MSRFDLRFSLVLGCFALSGFAGLLYETTWTREFSFVFGTSGLAVSTVLAAYMGGLALGSALAGRFVDRIRRPVLVYGVLELGIAAAALAVPWAIESARVLHVGLLRGVSEPGSVMALALYLTTSFAILCIPTTFMGATLPLLARHAVHSDAQIGPRIGALYALNTLGAIAGTIVTAFLLMPELGLRMTIYLGASLNGLIFLGAWALSRGDVATSNAGAPSAVRQATARSAPNTADRIDPIAGPSQRRILAIAGGAGIASFTYEVMWVRLIEHMLGGSVYAFAAMLASFLLGIAGGGAMASRLATDRARALRGLSISQIGVAVLSLLAYHGVMQMPIWIRQQGLFGDLEGLVETSGIATLLLLPSTLCIGAMLPFAVRALARDAEDAAMASARVYTWNTLGAIVGSIATGFVLLPELGFAGTALFAVGLNLALAALAWNLSQTRSRRVAAAFALAVVGLVIAPPRTPWPLLRSAPLKRNATALVDDKDVLFHAIGRSASVLAERLPTGIRISTNGMPEALIAIPGERPGKISTARWLGVLPALSALPTNRMLVIGLGGGVALEAIPKNVREVEVVELEPEVVAANRAVDRLRKFDVSADPRISIRLGDARSVLELEGEAYDAIVSQPSHPWTSGSSHLYTREFFERVRSRLRPGGIFVQWIGLAFVDEPLLRSFVATLNSVFPNVRLYRPTWSGALFVASDRPLDLENQIEPLRQHSAEPLRRVGLTTPEALAAVLSLDEAGSRAFAKGAPIITDDFNTMASRAPWVRRQTRESFDDLFAAYDPLRGGRSGIAPARLVEALFLAQRASYLDGFIQQLPTGPARTLAAGRFAELKGRRAEALAYYESIDAAAEEADEARWYRARLGRDRIANGTVQADFPDDSGAATVIQAWQAFREHGYAGLEAFDQRLATIGPDDFAHEDAVTARIDWRLLDSEPRRAVEALDLIDSLDRPWTTNRLVDRAHAAARAGNDAAALDSLRELASIRAQLAPADLVRARDALAAIDSERIDSEERAQIRQMLGRSGKQ